MPTPLTLRLVKGSTLTFSELDDDLTALKTTADNALSLASTAVQSINTLTGTAISLYTTSVPEGTNLYFTNSRVQSYLASIYNQPNGAAGLDASGYISSSVINTIDFNKLINLPFSLAGYGITDAYTITQANSRFLSSTGYALGQINYGQASGSVALRTITAGTNVTITENTGSATLTFSVTSIPWSSVTSTPTLLVGYGITDAYTKTQSDTNYLKTTGYSLGQIWYGQSGGSTALRVLTAGNGISITENVGAGTLTISDTVFLGNFTVATLPVGTNGQIAYATDGRKAGEGAGVGTGVLVVYTNSNWRDPSQNYSIVVS